MTARKYIVLVDIDHVISHAAPRDYLIGGNWEKYHELGKHDLPCTDMIELINTFNECGEINVIACTARPEKWRQQTNEWLLKQKVYIDYLLMRPDDCYLPSGECKIAIVKKHLGDDFAEKIICMIDDNQNVIDAFQKAGVTCLMCYGRDYK